MKPGGQVTAQGQPMHLPLGQWSCIWWGLGHSISGRFGQGLCWWEQSEISDDTRNGLKHCKTQELKPTINSLSLLLSWEKRGVCEQQHLSVFVPLGEELYS